MEFVQSETDANNDKRKSNGVRNFTWVVIVSVQVQVAWLSSNDCIEYHIRYIKADMIAALQHK